MFFLFLQELLDFIEEVSEIEELCLESLPTYHRLEGKGLENYAIVPMEIRMEYLKDNHCFSSSKPMVDWNVTG
ncbi:hypothetical protein BpHYR1_017388 [Brachionus plicatilis]|uniref:Uncharacterized protein n=1 Tax=Brachionus plicatilis TaxID=10195 RepID=A0A3M7QFN8_BRAPC|nr:hypothetical protein BpHYR1_017388 [Brachionus plicatilis]